MGDDNWLEELRAVHVIGLSPKKKKSTIERINQILLSLLPRSLLFLILLPDRERVNEKRQGDLSWANWGLPAKRVLTGKNGFTSLNCRKIDDQCLGRVIFPSHGRSSPAVKSFLVFPIYLQPLNFLIFFYYGGGCYYSQVGKISEFYQQQSRLVTYLCCLL